MLADFEGIQVIGQACSGEDAIHLVRELQPDVVLMDVLMPGIGGLGAIQKLCSREEPVRVIAVSACEEGEMPEMILQAGALGYLTKGASADEMLKAIRTVMAGRRHISPAIAEQLLDSRLEPQKRKVFAELSDREMQTVILVTQGLSTQQIADRLFVSPKTVNTYRYRVFDKLGIDSDVALTLMAVREGLIDPKSAS